MKTNLGMDDILAGFITNRMMDLCWVQSNVEHFDCQDTDGDGRVECYFYVNDYIGKNHLERMNKSLADMLGVLPTNMIEDDMDEGHKGEYRFEYIVNLKSEE